MGDLVHPPAHRGPLIAAGAVTLSVGVALLLLRADASPSAVAVTAGALAAAWLWLAFQGGLGGPPPAYASVLVVTGLSALAAALVGFAELLDEEELGAGSATWVALVVCGVAAWVSARRRSAVAALISALAGGVALLAAWDWIFSPESATPFRWLLLILAFAYGLASLPLRGTSLRHAEQMVNAAGVAILVVPGLAAAEAFFSSETTLPGFWELVVLAAGLSLVAYAAADRAPGPAYLGVANLGAFVLVAGVAEDTLTWWPLLLLAVGGAMVLAGLRPRRPLPPEPESSTRPDDLPLTVRVHRN